MHADPSYSADYMQGATMKFKTREDAIHFVSRSPRMFFARLTLASSQAEKQGWNYHVDKEHKERIPPKSYGMSSRAHNSADYELILGRSGELCAYSRQVATIPDQVDRQARGRRLYH
jgi:hypothetical protein